MPPKRRQPSQSTQPAKRTRSSSSAMASANATTLNGCNMQDLSPSALASLPAKTLRSHLKGHNLSAAGSKLIMANRLLSVPTPDYAHANDPSSTPGNTVAPTITETQWLTYR